MNFGTVNIKGLQMEKKALAAKIKRLTIKLDDAINTEGVVLDSETADDMTAIMTEKDKSIANKFPEDSFQRFSGNKRRNVYPKKESRRTVSIGIHW